MNPVSFSDCIRNNSETLGQHCENLGRSLGTGFLGARKVLFSYDATSGWSVVQLNALQLFLRNVLGFYKPTHTDTILKEWKVLKNDKCEALNIPKIQDFWEKRYFIKFGNTQSNGEFQVRCYGEEHGKKFYRKQVCEDISKNYRPGDIILVEGVVAGTKITKNDMQTTSGLEGDKYDIEGWEPENFEQLQPEFIVEFKQKEKSLIELTEATSQAIDDYSNSKNLDEFIKNTSGFVSKYNELVAYFSPENKPLPQDFINRLSESASKAENPMLFMKVILLKLTAQLTKNVEKRLYKRSTTEDINTIRNGIALRNKSLHDQIEKYAMDGRRVFVLGGQSHFLFDDDGIGPKEFLKPVHDALSKHKFEIFCKRALVVKHGSSSLGVPELR